MGRERVRLTTWRCTPWWRNDSVWSTGNERSFGGNILGGIARRLGNWWGRPVRTSKCANQRGGLMGGVPVRDRNRRELE